MAKAKSAKGVVVDFDLLKIKEQMASAPPPTDVKARADFIDKRLRRRLRRVKPPAPKVEPVDVDKKLPDAPPEAEKIEEKEETKPKTRTRQRARPKSENTSDE